MALPAPTQGKDEGAVAAAAGQRTSQSQGQRWLQTHTLTAHARHRPEEVSRGQVFNEFNAMDFWHTGKLTLAQLEDEGLALGLQPHHIASLYSRLDPKAQGFFTIKDWGRPQLSQQVRELVRLAERSKRGPGTVRTPDVEVTNPTLAIQLALFKLQLRVNGRHQPSHEQLLQAFTFIDADNSGMLSRDELEDAFHGLNINVTPQVVDQMMRQFDEDGDGRIQYREFLHALFPIVSSARRLASKASQPRLAMAPSPYSRAPLGMQAMQAGGPPNFGHGLPDSGPSTAPGAGCATGAGAGPGHGPGLSGLLHPPHLSQAQHQQHQQQLADYQRQLSLLQEQLKFASMEAAEERRKATERGGGAAAG
ncbi:hypothetical protein QJQ45_015344 [Haematococcus lacustris]|nr:hypothetical protein QJQ45_015344 [Haematococcus lacustris]